MQRLFSTCLLMTLLGGTVLADTMTCGQYMIQSGETNPVTKDEVEQQCGQPTAKEGNDWIYQRAGENTKILHFNDNGGLESISERVGD